MDSISSYQASITAGLWNKHIRTQKQTVDIGIHDTIYLNRNPNDPAWLQTAFDYYIEITNSVNTLPSIKNVSLDTIIKLAINASIIKTRILFNISESYSIPTLTLLCNQYNALPITNKSDYNNFNLSIIYDISNKFSNEYESTLYSFNRYLNTSSSSNLEINKTIMAIQKPELLLQGFLTDFIISNNLFIIWLSNLCVNPKENELYQNIVLSSYYTTNQSVSISIMGYYPNNEVLADCTSTHGQISFVSDFVISLSFHQLLPSIISYLPYKYLTQIPYNKNIKYDKTKKYLSLIQSDGDNIQLDMNGLRPRMNERINLCSPSNRSNNICPKFGWTISNRLIDLAPHIIYWFYNISNKITNVDSFLMGPSGYGYLYPSIISPQSLQDMFIENTIFNGYLAGEMQGNVYWDYLGTIQDMNTYLMKYDNYNYSKIDNGRINDTNYMFNGFFSDSPFINEYIGDNILTFKMSYSWNHAISPQVVAKSLNEILIEGSLTYLYKIWDVTFYEVEEMVKLLDDDIILVDYREMIVLANDKRTTKGEMN